MTTPFGSTYRAKRLGMVVDKHGVSRMVNCE